MTLKIYEGGYHGIVEGESDERISSVHNDTVLWLNIIKCSWLWLKCSSLYWERKDDSNAI